MHLKPIHPPARPPTRPSLSPCCAADKGDSGLAGTAQQQYGLSRRLGAAGCVAKSAFHNNFHKFSPVCSQVCFLQPQSFCPPAVMQDWEWRPLFCAESCYPPAPLIHQASARGVPGCSSSSCATDQPSAEQAAASALIARYEEKRTGHRQRALAPCFLLLH